MTVANGCGAALGVLCRPRALGASTALARSSFAAAAPRLPSVSHIAKIDSVVFLSNLLAANMIVIDSSIMPSAVGTRRRADRPMAGEFRPRRVSCLSCRPDLLCNRCLHGDFPSHNAEDSITSPTSNTPSHVNCPPPSLIDRLGMASDNTTEHVPYIISTSPVGLSVASSIRDQIASFISSDFGVDNVLVHV